MLGLFLGLATRAISYVRKLFSPAELFANGEQGAWYDPSDLTTMFQDAAGTTPVTAVEQPVGLILDKSKGLVLGPELVTNGTFDTATGWTEVAPWSISAGAAVTSATGAGKLQFAAATVTAGKTYEVSYTYSLTSGAIQGDLGNSGIFPVHTGPASGTYTGRVTPTTAGSPFGMYSNNAVGTLDNISVRELPGNHARQSTASSRPVLSARVNLLTKTEQFDDAAWLKGGTGSVTGTNTINLPADADYVSGSIQAYPFVAGAAFTGKMTLSGTGTVYLRIKRVGSGTYEQFLQLCTLTPTPTVFTVNATFVNAHNGVALDVSRAGTTATTFTAINASLVPANQASLPYQRVNTATDYDTVGFPHYLKFDGIDDGLRTGSIDFTATDKMTVVAGVRKLSDSVIGMFAELSADINVNRGAFFIAAPDTTGISGNFSFASKGSLLSFLTVSSSGTVLAPNTSIISGIGNISGDSALLRRNGVNAIAGTGDQGTGNYGNYPLYIGSRAGPSLPFNGHIYSLIVRGAASTDAQIVSAETYVNSKTGAY